MKVARPAAKPRTTAPRQIVIDLKGLRNRQAMLERIATALGFPGHFGHNLDALYDCLTDLKIAKSKPLEVVLHGVGTGTAVQSVAAVFDEAAEWFAERGLTFTVQRT